MTDHAITVDWDGSKFVYSGGIHGKKDEHFQWCTHAYSLTVKFKDPPGNPLQSEPGVVTNPDPSQRLCDTKDKVVGDPNTYPYGVSLVAVQGQKPHNEDPQVIIDGGSFLSGWLVVGAIIVVAAIALGVRRFLRAAS